MSPVNRETEDCKHLDLSERGASIEMSTDFSHVLVVGKSPINRVVVSKIVEKSGLKPISESPETAAKALRSLIPGAVVLDGGADNKDCDTLMSGIDALAAGLGQGTTLGDPAFNQEWHARKPRPVERDRCGGRPSRSPPKGCSR